MIYSPVDHDRTSREVERQIESLVLEGVLRAGDRLPGERDLSKSLNVSRPILRQALDTLVERSLLTVRHGGGTFVADVTGTVFDKSVVELIGQNARAKSDYLEYRREIEGMAASMAAQRATEPDKQLLKRIIADMKTAHLKNDTQRGSALDVEFHSTVGECAHNIILLHTLRSCYQLLTDDVFFNRQLIFKNAEEKMRDMLLDQHVQICDSILAGDADGAERNARDHITFVEAVTRKAELKNEWNSVAKLRFEQREDRVSKKRKTRKS